jgi:hypothetical protein
LCDGIKEYEMDRESSTHVTQIFHPVLVGKPEGGISLRGSRRIHKIIFSGFEIYKSKDVDWTELAQDKFHWWDVTDAVMHFRVL